MMIGRTWRDIGLAFLISILGAAIAWGLATGLPVIGIDDAAITRSYAENIANGHGYVYNVGGERVEGSTTLLWVLILTVLYALTDTPELLVVGATFGLSVLAVFCSLRLTRAFCDWLEINQIVPVLVLSILLLASPGYFMWSVWTMMELALWSAFALAFLLLIARSVELELSRSGYVLIGIVAFCLPMIRPEGIALALGLLGVAVILRPSVWRSSLVAGVIAVAVFVAITAFRISYFGQPFPNTFYAKVSSDRLQDLADGTKYMLSFLLGGAFVEVFVAAWFVAVGWALATLSTRIAGNRALVLAGVFVAGFLVVYAVLGGDHFALWRFYQPIAPLLPVALALGLGGMAQHFMGGPSSRRNVLAVPALCFALGALGIGWLQYFQARFFVQSEFRLVERGVSFGEYLSDAEPAPIIGVGPAGGIALGYDGEILDLLGLNWTVMAHANPLKVGMRNHASFHKPTFWTNSPDVVATFNWDCSAQAQQSWPRLGTEFEGLFMDADFRQQYRPVLFQDGGSCWPGFAKPSWIDGAIIDGMTVLDWSDVSIRE
ncbi:MAG: hypothetical protein AAFV87_02900 [Pseudomonadota bacterium]